MTTRTDRLADRLLGLDSEQLRLLSCAVDGYLTAQAPSQAYVLKAVEFERRDYRTVAVELYGDATRHESVRVTLYRARESLRRLVPWIFEEQDDDTLPY